MSHAGRSFHVKEARPYIKRVAARRTSLWWAALKAEALTETSAAIGQERYGVTENVSSANRKAGAGVQDELQMRSLPTPRGGARPTEWNLNGTRESVLPGTVAAQAALFCPDSAVNIAITSPRQHRQAPQRQLYFCEVSDSELWVALKEFSYFADTKCALDDGSQLNKSKMRQTSSCITVSVWEWGSVTVNGPVPAVKRKPRWQAKPAIFFNLALTYVASLSSKSGSALSVGLGDKFCHTPLPSWQPCPVQKSMPYSRRVTWKHRVTPYIKSLVQQHMAEVHMQRRRLGVAWQRTQRTLLSPNLPSTWIMMQLLQSGQRTSLGYTAFLGPPVSPYPYLHQVNGWTCSDIYILDRELGTSTVLYVCVSHSCATMIL